MELIFLILMVVLAVKLLQMSSNRSLRASEDYQRGYWDGVRDAQAGRARIEDSGSQAKLITKNQKAVPQSSGLVLIGGEEEEPDAVSPTDAAPIEESVNIPAKEVKILSEYRQLATKKKRKIVKPPSTWHSILRHYC